MISGLHLSWRKRIPSYYHLRCLPVIGGHYDEILQKVMMKMELLRSDSFAFDCGGYSMQQCWQARPVAAPNWNLEAGFLDRLTGDYCD